MKPVKLGKRIKKAPEMGAINMFVVQLKIGNNAPKNVCLEKIIVKPTIKRPI
jgi:hypothetical protein